MRWEARYSPSEMMILDVGRHDVRCYLHHSPNLADHFTFAEVLADQMGPEIPSVFSNQVIAELKQAIRQRSAT